MSDTNSNSPDSSHNSSNAHANRQQSLRKDARGVAKATGIVSSLTLLSRILGFIRDSVIASYFGAGMATDAFFVAFRIPNLLRSLVAEGSMSAAFVPVLSEEKARSDEAARVAISGVTTYSLIITIILTVCGMIWAEEVTHFFAPGFGANSEKMELATWLLRVMFPYVIIISLTALASSALNTFGCFAQAAAAAAILNIVMVFAILVLSPILDIPIAAVAYSVPIGGLIALVMQAWQLKRIGFPLKPGNPFRGKAVAKLLWLMIPSVVSSSSYQLMVFMNTLLASMLAEGSVSYLYYADRIFQFPLGVFSLAVATATLPTMSRYAVANDTHALNRQVTSTIGWITFITIPASVGLIVLAEPIIVTLFQRGQFDHYASVKTTQALCGYAIGIWPISCQSILVRCFLAKKNSLLPSMVMTFGMCVNLVCALSTVDLVPMSTPSEFERLIISVAQSLHVYSLGHVGLAISGSIGCFVSMFLITLCLPIIKIDLDLKYVLKNVGLAAVGSLAMSISIILVDKFIDSAIITMCMGILIGSVVYFSTTMLIGMQEAKTCLAELPNVWRKILRKKS